MPVGNPARKAKKAVKKSMKASDKAAKKGKKAGAIRDKKIIKGVKSAAKRRSSEASKKKPNKRGIY
jgi:hypothetical protein